MPTPLLNGEVEYVEPIRLDIHGERLTALEDRVEQLEAKLANVKRESVIALLNLLSESMRQIAAGKFNLSESSAGGAEEKWEAVKQRMPPRHREAVDILLLQGSMKRTEIASALKMNYTNCATNVLAVMIRQGWLIDNGGSLSLKQL